MIRITNREAFHAKVTNWLGSVRDMAEQAAVSMAYETLHLLLESSPQHSGDFVANWNVSIDTPDYSWGENLVGGRTYFQGHRDSARYSEGSRTAIDYAVNKVDLSGFRLGQSIFLANNATHTHSIERASKTGEGFSFAGDVESHYAVKIEENKIKFRPENPSGGRVMARALQQASVRYANLTRTRIASLIGA